MMDLPPIPGRIFDCTAKHGYVTIKPNGTSKPCCRWEDYSPIVDNFENFEQILDHFQSVIRTPTAEWPIGCQACHRDTSFGRKCVIDGMNKFIVPTGNTIQSLEVGFDNICNMNCVMCNPQFSSRWNKIYKENKEFLDPYHDFSEYEIQSPIYDNVIRLMENSDLSRLHTIRLMGGEPMYSKVTLKFLEWFTDRDVSNIKLKFNTNATVFPHKFTELFKKFKTVEPETSIDGVEEVNEWGRNGGTWKEIQEVIKLWNEFARENSNIKMRNHTTITLANMEHLGRLSEWISQFDKYQVRRIGIAANQYISCLSTPKEFRQQLWNEQNVLFDDMDLYEKYEVFLGHEQKTTFETKRIIKYIEWFDTLNQVKFKDISPKAWKQLNEQL